MSPEPERARARRRRPRRSWTSRPYLDPAPRDAPPIRLTDPDDRPFELASLRGGPVFVFFGYTHCADVCPATIGTVGLALDARPAVPRERSS